MIKSNVMIAFTDCEEVGGRGMNRLLEQVENGVYDYPESMYALELTANGDKYWIQGTYELNDSLFLDLQESMLEGELTAIIALGNSLSYPNNSVLTKTEAQTLAGGELFTE